MLTLRKLSMNVDSSYCLIVERLEGTSGEELSNIDDPQGISKVRLICTELEHRILVRDNGIRCSSYSCALGCELLECSCKDLLTCSEYILLSSKAHLEVELIELSGRSVRTCILVSEAGSDLEILIESGYHQELLELLRRLGKSIELALILS